MYVPCRRATVDGGSHKPTYSPHPVLDKRRTHKPLRINSFFDEVAATEYRVASSPKIPPLRDRVRLLEAESVVPSIGSHSKNATADAKIQGGAVEKPFRCEEHPSIFHSRLIEPKGDRHGPSRPLLLELHVVLARISCIGIQYSRSTAAT